MADTRIPLIQVDNPIPEPHPLANGYTPSWAGPTPDKLLIPNLDPDDASALVTDYIRRDAHDRIQEGLTPGSPQKNRDELWNRNRMSTKEVMSELWPQKEGAGGKRLKTLFSGQWADVPLEEFVAFAKDAGFEGVELACWHFNLQRALVDDEYCTWIRMIFKKYDLKLVAISAHLVGQAVLDNVDRRHKGILPEYVWGDGNSHGVNLRAAQEMMDTVMVAKRLGVSVINGFTGSSIWNLVYDFPPATPGMIDDGFRLFADRWNAILDVFAKSRIYFALEVHPTEIAYDIVTAKRALEALDYRPEFGFNYDPSHLIWQGVDYVQFISEFGDRIYHVHMKDAFAKFGGRGSVLGSFLAFGNIDRGFDFVSLGRGDINFTHIIRALNAIGYLGPLSNEWEDSGMDRSEGAREASKFITEVDFGKSNRRMDEAFSK